MLGALARLLSRTIASVLLLPIRFYRRLISPWTPPSCRFTPSCSAYAEEALRTLNPIKAVGLIAWRIVRCQPFCEGGYDPVPGTDHPPEDSGA